LYTSTLIAIWQRLVNLNISWGSDTLGKVMRKRGRFTVDVLLQVIDGWLTFVGC
jgi:hypothetical protein